MKNISQVILLSTSCLIWYGADNVCASVNVFSGIPKSGTHNTLHTTPYLAYPHLPSAHPRGVAESSPRLVPSAESAMLTSCLPQALSSSSLSRGGWRKENNPVNCFLTTGESLLTGELVETTRSQCYKPSDRSGVAELLSEAYEARRWGVTSEASISLCSKRYNLSFEGLIPPRELLTRLKSEEFLLPSIPSKFVVLPKHSLAHNKKLSLRLLIKNNVGCFLLRPSQGEDNKLNVFKTASVCFITDTGACSGRGGGENPVAPVTPIPPQPSPSEACEEAGYELTSCPSLSHGENFCPIDSSYFKTCVCDANMTQTCTKPYYGVGPQCDGKYASCEKDTPRACKEDGYGQSGACPDLQTPNKKCPYDSAYYDKCVCRSDLVTCTYPQSGVGEACGGKYASCQCPSSYKSCECGGAAGATSCTVNGVTTYSSCKECCSAEYIYDSSNCPAPKKLGGKACGGKYTTCEGLCSDAGYLDKIPSGKICNKITYSEKTCYTSCRENDIPPVAKQYCSTSDLSYEEYRKNGEYLGVIVGNVIVYKDVSYLEGYDCQQKCLNSNYGNRTWRYPDIKEINELRCAIVAMGGKTYDVYWMQGGIGGHGSAPAKWLFGEDYSGPSWMYTDSNNYCACISDL